MAQPHHAPPDLPSVQPVSLGHAATYADLEALPEHLRGEILRGQLYALPRPMTRHNRVLLSIAVQLINEFDEVIGGPGALKGWWILPEEELHLGTDVLVPDVAGWQREQLPTLPAHPERIRVAPAWICEVLSPSTEAYDRGPKMEIYAGHGVREAWLVDPEARTLEAFRSDGGRWRPAGTWRGHDAAAVGPFEALSLNLAQIWT